LCCLIMTCFYRHTGWGRGWQHVVTTFLATKWSEIVVLESERGWDPRATNRLVTECWWSQILLSSPLRMLVFQCRSWESCDLQQLRKVATGEDTVTFLHEHLLILVICDLWV
jgi:hypothetical protein